MNPRTPLLAFLIAGCAAAAGAAPQMYDMGTAKSALEPGFVRVSPETVATGSAAFGWTSREGLRGQARAYTNYTPDASRGTDTPPPIWTTPLTEDSILGARESSFVLPPPPGGGWLAVVCGTSDDARGQYFDFTVRVGDAEQRVRCEGGRQFRVLRFPIADGTGPLAVRFTPRSVWAVNAILTWTATETAQVEKDILRRFSNEPGAWAPAEEWARWKEDPEPDPGPMPTPAEADRGRGFLVFARHYLECVYPHDSPKPDELAPQLRIFATPGEYEPFTFSIRPLRDLAAARVSVRGLGPVTARDIDIRRVRFMRARPNYSTMHRWLTVPDVLERFETLDLPGGENARFWITVRVPDDAPAGVHTGAVVFSCSGGRAEIPVTLRILPFRLREDPDKLFGIYYEHPLDRARSATDEVSRAYFLARAEKEHLDMVAHGTRNVTLSCYSPPADAQGNFKIDWDTLQAEFDLWRRHGFRGPAVMHINAGGVYAKHTGERFGSHMKGVKDPPESFSREMTAMVRAIEAERVRRGFPEFLYYPIDEPSTDPASVRFMVTVLKACKDAGVRTYVTADRAHEAFAPMVPFVDIWCMQPYSLDRETVRREAAKGIETWCYPNHISGENNRTPVAGARMTYGFGFWRSGYRALIPWIYSSSGGDPMNYLDGGYQDFLNRHEPDGAPVPVAMWEAMREGYDDYRYLHTLERALAEARGSWRMSVRRAATEAAKELAEVETAIRVQPKYKHDDLWSPAEFDVHRWRIARQILAMHAALGGDPDRDAKPHRE